MCPASKSGSKPGYRWLCCRPWNQNFEWFSLPWLPGAPCAPSACQPPDETRSGGSARGVCLASTPRSRSPDAIPLAHFPEVDAEPDQNAAREPDIGRNEPKASQDDQASWARHPGKSEDDADDDDERTRGDPRDAKQRVGRGLVPPLEEPDVQAPDPPFSPSPEGEPSPREDKVSPHNGDSSPSNRVSSSPAS